MSNLNYEECQDLYWKTLNILDKRLKMEDNPLYIIQNIKYTENCDSIHNMKHLRNKTEDYINSIIPDLYDNILKMPCTGKTRINKIARQCVIHHKYEYKHELIRALNIKNKLRYYTYVYMRRNYYIWRHY